jgi:hypothetical protein
LQEEIETGSDSVGQIEPRFHNLNMKKAFQPQIVRRLFLFSESSFATGDSGSVFLCFLYAMPSALTQGRRRRAQ